MNDPTRYMAAADSSPQTTHKAFFALIVINVMVYLLQVIRGVHWLTPAVMDLFAWGGSAAPFTLDDEPWRLFTSMFLHGGIVHLAMNMYMLAICGALVERTFGTIRFIVLYLFSGLCGGLLSAIWNGSHKVGGDIFVASQLQFVVSVGASGALMGLAGGYLVSHLINGPEISEHQRSNSMHAAIWQTVLITMGMGFLIPGVDQAAHIGGLIGGAVAGYLLQLTPANKKWDRWFVMPSIVIVLGCAVSWIVLRQPLSQELQQLRAQVIERIADDERVASAERRQQAKVIAAVQDQQQLESIASADRASITVVDAKTAAGVVIPVDVSSEAPMLLNRTEQFAYISGLYDNSIVQVDMSSGSRLKMINGGSTRAKRKAIEGCSDDFCLGRGATEMLLSPDERTLYVSSLREDHVGVIDLATGAVSSTIPVGRFPRVLVGTADGARAYVFNALDNSVSMLDLTKTAVVGEAHTLAGGPSQFTSFGRSMGMWLSADEQQLYVADDIADQLEALDANTLTAVYAAPLESAFLAGGQSGDKKMLAVLTDAGVDMYGLAPLRQLQRFDFCNRIASFNVALNDDASLLAISAVDLNVVLLLRLTTRKLIGVYPTRHRPMDLRFSKDGLRMYVQNGRDQSISILNTAKSIDVRGFVEQHGEPFCSS